jgi:hypothetical protein
VDKFTVRKASFWSMPSSVSVLPLVVKIIQFWEAGKKVRRHRLHVSHKGRVTDDELVVQLVGAWGRMLSAASRFLPQIMIWESPLVYHVITLAAASPMPEVSPTKGATG